MTRNKATYKKHCLINKIVAILLAMYLFTVLFALDTPLLENKASCVRRRPLAVAVESARGA